MTIIGIQGDTGVGQSDMGVGQGAMGVGQGARGDVASERIVALAHDAS